MLACFVTVVCFISTLAYWGDIPSTRQLVRIAVLQNDARSVTLILQSFLTHHMELDLKLSSISALHVAYDVVESKRIQRKPLSPCQFQGTVSGIIDSMVLMSNCSGFFRGSISQNNTIIYLSVESGQSVVFLDTDLPVRYERFDYSDLTNSTLLIQDVEISEDFRYKREDPAVPPVLLWPKKTLEVVVATDKALWQKYDRNVTKLEEYVLATINAIDAIYRQYNVRIALMGVEYWRGRDEIKVTEEYSLTLRNFTGYRQDQLLKVFRGHDVSILMTGVDFKDQIVGYAGVGTMCRSSSANVNYDSRKNPLFFATVISHELGHNLGMYHDSNDCSCAPHSSCIMAPALSSPVGTFSDCSQNVLQDFKGKCLDNHPTKLYTDPICGNGFVEEGEECDCGTVEECLTTDPCCEPSGCKLKIDSECYTGECCTKCKFKSYKKNCRPQRSECDLEEYCTGTDAECPVNRFRQDGSNCANFTGWCMYGSCQTHDAQCRLTYGERSSKARTECYTKYNRMGKWYGNCGSLGKELFLKCRDNDVMCGTAYCNIAGSSIPRIRGTSNYTLPLDDGGKCSLVFNILGSENNDIGLVYDGTKCADDKWCKGGYCTEFEKPPCPSPGGHECASFGQCNDLNQCHCYSGYDPEYNCAILLKVAGWNVRNILIGVLIVALVVLPIIVMAIILMRKHNMRCNKFWTEHTNIRFSVRLPSITRSASYVRRRQQSKKGQQKGPRAASDSMQPPKRPTSIPGGNGTITYDNRPRSATYGGPPPRPAPPVPANLPPARPPPPVPANPPPARPAPWHFARHISEEREASDSKPSDSKPSYTPLRTAPEAPSPAITPARPAPGIPGEKGHTRSTSANLSAHTSPVKSGPRILQGGTKDNIKMDISGPEFPRSLTDDRPLDERMLAGSPLMDLNDVKR